MQNCRELDKIVAEKIMGWTDVHWLEIPHREPLLMGKHPDKTHKSHLSNDKNEHVPDFSTNILAAWEVFEKVGKEMIGEKKYSVCRNENFYADNWVARFDTEKIEVKEVGDTAPLAICLGALKFLNIPV